MRAYRITSNCDRNRTIWYFVINNSYTYVRELYILCVIQYKIKDNAFMYRIQ